MNVEIYVFDLTSRWCLFIVDTYTDFVKFIICTSHSSELIVFWYQAAYTNGIQYGAMGALIMTDCDASDIQYKWGRGTYSSCAATSADNKK